MTGAPANVQDAFKAACGTLAAECQQYITAAFNYTG